MPRRQPTAEVPRWRRGQQKQQSGPVVRLSPKQEKALVAKLAAQAGLPAPATATPAAPGVNKALAATGAYRFRRHLPPVAWLGWVLAAGLGTHGHNTRLGIVLAIVTGAGIWLLTRHLPDCPTGEGRKHAKCFTRHAWQAMAALGALWIAALCLTGATPPCPHVLVGIYRAVIAVSALAVIVPWVRHYRWVRDEPVAKAQQVTPTDYVIWAKLAAKRRWSGRLGAPEEIPGGVRYPIILDGSETDIGEVLGQPRKVAAAWGKAMTEAYVEPSHDGVESKGSLTLLRRGTLEKTREWDGSGVDHDTGMAVIGRYADSTPARIRFYARRDGIRHGLIAGATGAGKTYLLDLLVRIALTTGFIVPVILDPQEGQSLPQWRKRLPYAAGVEECMAMLHGLQSGMLDRSRYLSSLRWKDEDGFEHEGADFYDYQLTGLKQVLVIGDEFPVLLTHPKFGPEAIRVAADIGKRGRKTGVSLWPVAQVPSLSELGDQVVRSMLVGGNVVCLRTGDRVSAGMLGLDVDPSSLPRYFPDGSPTYGLGYVVGPDNRQAVARVDLVSAAARRNSPAVPELEPNFADWLDTSLKAARIYRARQDQLSAPSAGHPLAAVPPPADDEPAPEGRTASDAILAVLDKGGELDRGELLVLAGKLVTGQWGRPHPFKMSTWSHALEKLLADGRIAKPKHGTYAPLRATVHVLPGNDHETSEATGA